MKQILAIVLSCALATQGWAEETIHKASGIKFPSQVGALELGKTTDYGSKERPGMAVPFSAGDIQATVFIRKIAKGDFPSAGGYLDESIDVVKELVEQGVYEKLKLFESDGKNDREGWAGAAFSVRSEGVPLISFMHTTIQAGHTVKIRISSPVADAKESFALVEQLQELVEGGTSKASPCFSAAEGRIRAAKTQGTKLDSISLMREFPRDARLHRELLHQFQKDHPKELAAALASAGNMHNPKVQGLRKKFAEALLKTPTMLKIANGLSESGQKISSVSFEKFSINKDHDPLTVHAFLWLKIEAIEEKGLAPAVPEAETK